MLQGWGEVPSAMVVENNVFGIFWGYIKKYFCSSKSAVTGIHKVRKVQARGGEEAGSSIEGYQYATTETGYNRVGG